MATVFDWHRAHLLVDLPIKAAASWQTGIRGDALLRYYFFLNLTLYLARPSACRVWLWDHRLGSSLSGGTECAVIGTDQNAIFVFADESHQLLALVADAAGSLAVCVACMEIYRLRSRPGLCCS